MAGLKPSADRIFASFKDWRVFWHFAPFNDIRKRLSEIFVSIRTPGGNREM